MRKLRRVSSRSATAVAWAAALLLAPGAQAADGGRAYRCVIEPAVTVQLGSPVPGLLANVPVARGDTVTEGQLVAELDRQLEQATLDLNRLRAENTAPVKAARARLGLDAKQLERAEELHRRKVTAAETVDERRAAVEVRRQELREVELERRIRAQEVARSEVLVEQRLVHSPIDGVVTEKRLSAGEFVHQEAYIVEIAKLDPLHVEAYLPIALYERVQVGMGAVVTPQAPLDGRHEAKVTVVDKVLDAASGTFGVRLEVPNADMALPAGIHCRVRFPEINDSAAVSPGNKNRG